MIVRGERLRVHLPEARTLKEKRSVVKSFVVQGRRRFNAAVAEVGALDDLTHAEIGVATVSHSVQHAERTLAQVRTFLEGRYPAEIIAVERYDC